MDFGRVPATELDEVDFSLPADPAFNRAVLKGKPVPKPSVFIGCTRWGRAEWIGKIYPRKSKEKDFLKYYTEHFNCIEFNATHYKLFGEEYFRKWKGDVGGKQFKFCPKMYQGVTHRGSLRGKDFVLNEFFRGIVAFEEYLGPIFIQVSETFSPKRKEELFDFLKTLPTDLQFFMEVRHPDWFRKPEITAELFTMLKEMNIGAVITDTAGRRDCAHMYLSLPKTFIRYVGNSLHASDYTRIDAWVDRMKRWLDSGMEELYFFMHMHDEATSPELTVYLVDKMNKELGLDLVKPRFIGSEGKQAGLFD